MWEKRPLRSVLYVPGDHQRAMTKASVLPVDAIIYDLEDAVAPMNKASARKRVCEAVRDRAAARCLLAIRINDLATQTGVDDLREALGVKPDAIVLPKVQTVQDIEELSARIEASGVDVKIWAMVETPMAVLNVNLIAESATTTVQRLGALIFGTNDLGMQTSAAPDMMAPWQMNCVLAAKAYDLAIIDGVYNNFSNESGLRRECERGRDRGFDGKTLIHPAQIACANEMFSPTKAQMIAARELVALFERVGHESANVLELHGKMVERLHYEMALKTLSIGKIIEEMDQ